MNYKEINDKNDKNDKNKLKVETKTEQESFFDRLDEKIFGFKGRVFFKKYKSEILLIIIGLLLLLTVLYCFIPDNKNKRG